MIKNSFFGLYLDTLIQRGEISYIPWCFAAYFYPLFAAEKALEGFEGDFQWAEFQDLAHPR